MKAEKRADHYDGRHGKSFFDCIATIYLMTIRCCRSRMVFCIAGIFGGEADIESMSLNIVLYAAVLKTTETVWAQAISRQGEGLRPWSKYL